MLLSIAFMYLFKFVFAGTIHVIVLTVILISYIRSSVNCLCTCKHSFVLL